MESRENFAKFESHLELENALVSRLAISENDAGQFLSSLIDDKVNFLRLFGVAANITHTLTHVRNDLLKEKLMDAVLSPAYFTSIFNDAYSIKNFVRLMNVAQKPGAIWPIDKEFGDACLDKLKQRLFDMDTLMQFMKNPKNIGILIGVFPDLRQHLVDYVSSHEEVIKNARLLSQGERSNTSLFSNLPREILLMIAKETKTYSEHSEKNAEALAARNFNKPK